MNFSFNTKSCDSVSLADGAEEIRQVASLIEALLDSINYNPDTQPELSELASSALLAVELLAEKMEEAA